MLTQFPVECRNYRILGLRRLSKSKVMAENPRTMKTHPGLWIVTGCLEHQCLP